MKKKSSHTTYAVLAKKAHLSVSYMWKLVNDPNIRPNWRRAKQLAEITGTDPVMWLDAPKSEIKNALRRAAS